MVALEETQESTRMTSAFPWLRTDYSVPKAEPAFSSRMRPRIGLKQKAGVFYILKIDSSYSRLGAIFCVRSILELENKADMVGAQGLEPRTSCV